MKVWDLPTRLFHWGIVVLVAGSWWSAETGRMDWHYLSGLAALVLLIFRLLWGVIGGSTARFSHFVRSPGAVLLYLRQPAPAVRKGGHNPLGGYSVVAMLAVLLIQVGTGLLSVDVDGIESGPLSYLISFDAGRIAAEIHHLSFTAVQALVVLHVIAIVYYRLRGRRLVGPMVTGRDRQLGPDADQMHGGGGLRAGIVLALSLALGWWVSLGAPL